MTKLTWTCAACLLATAALAGPNRGWPQKPRHDAKGAIVLNGERTRVRWTDGDSFNFEEGLYQGQGTRLKGYNSLEAFGPVHSWGKWTAEELYENALGASKVAAAQVWTCTTDAKEDGYRRLLIDCPDLAVEMARTGSGMAYSIEGEPVSPAVLAAQKEAQASGAGMWRKGVVRGVVTSVHSLGERGGEASAENYNRVVDSRTGVAAKRPHQKKYSTCEKVCESAEGEESCMVYVPFERRYRNQPDCLK